MRLLNLIFFLLLICNLSGQVTMNGFVDDERFRIFVFPNSISQNECNDLSNYVSKQLNLKLANLTSDKKIVILEREAEKLILKDKIASEKTPEYYDRDKIVETGKFLSANYTIVVESEKTLDNKYINVSARIFNSKSAIDNAISDYIGVEKDTKEIDSVTTLFAKQLLDFVPPEYKTPPLSTDKLYNNFISDLSLITKVNDKYIDTVNLNLLKHPDLDVSKNILGVLHSKTKKTRNMSYSQATEETVILNEEGIYWTQKNEDETEFGNLVWYDYLYEDIRFNTYFRMEIIDRNKQEFLNDEDRFNSWFSSIGEKKPLNISKDNIYYISSRKVYEEIYEDSIKNKRNIEYDTIAIFNDNLNFFVIDDNTLNKKYLRKKKSITEQNYILSKLDLLEGEMDILNIINNISKNCR